MDRLKQLETYSTPELIAELRRRMDELDEARALLGGSGTGSVKNPAMSSAKAAYWKAWHQYRAAHPAATVAEWRKGQKASRRSR